MMNTSQKQIQLCLYKQIIKLVNCQQHTILYHQTSPQITINIISTIVQPPFTSYLKLGFSIFSEINKKCKVSSFYHMKTKRNKHNNPKKVKRTKQILYLLRELAVTRRRSSMVEDGEEGKIPKSIRHWTPLRSPKRRDDSSTTRTTVDSIGPAAIFSLPKILSQEKNENSQTTPAAQTSARINQTNNLNKKS